MSTPFHSQLRAPFHGTLTWLVAEGDHVDSNAPVAVLEALKMESVLTAPAAGTISNLVHPPHGLVSGGDLLAQITPRLATSPR